MSIVGAVDRHAIQLGHADVRTAVLHDAAGAALQSALLRFVRHRQPQLQGRFPARGKLPGDRGAKTAPTTSEYTFNNQVPVSLTQWATPYGLKAQNKDFGFYAQDQWTLRRLTLTYGVRYEYFNGYVPAQHVPATPNGWVPERNFAEVKNVPLWKDVDPRVGAAYDLFGNGTDGAQGGARADTCRRRRIDDHPEQQSDPDVDQLGQPHVERQLLPGRRPAPRQLHAGLRPGEPRRRTASAARWPTRTSAGLDATTRYADDALLGYGARGYNWDFTTEVQHQLRPGVSMTGGYYRNWFGSFLVTDNTLVTPADFEPVLHHGADRFAAARRRRLSGLRPVRRRRRRSSARSTASITQSDNFGKMRRVNDFFNVTLNARLGSGVQFGGGVDTGRSVNDACFNVDSPGAVAAGLPGNLVGAAPESCPLRRRSPPRRSTASPSAESSRRSAARRSSRRSSTYPLPGDIIVSAVFQNISGPTITANYAAPNAQIAPSLGRNLAACRGAAACTSTATVPLIAPQTMFDDRLTRLDLRLAKRIRADAADAPAGATSTSTTCSTAARARRSTPTTVRCGCSPRCCRTAAWSSSARA